MTTTSLEQFARRIERSHSQFVRGIISTEELGRAVQMECAQARSSIDLGRGHQPRVSEYEVYAVGLEWMPLSFVASVVGQRHPDRTPLFDEHHPLRVLTTARFADGLARASTSEELSDFGERISELGPSLLPADLVDAYIDRACTAARIDNADEPGDRGDVSYLDPVLTRVWLQRAVSACDLAAVAEISEGAWRVARDPCEIVDGVTAVVRWISGSAGMDLIDRFPVSELAEERMWSPLAALASLSSEAGDDVRAATLSGLVVDDLVDDGTNPYEGLWRVPSHTWGLWELSYNDVQLFGPLAFIDLATGNATRAERRARRFGSGWDQSGFLSAGSRALAWWVLQAVEPQSRDRMGLLQSIAGIRHVWLGAMVSRVSLSLATTQLELGDDTAAAAAFEEAERALGRNGLKLHFSDYDGFGTLFDRIAVTQAELDALRPTFAHLSPVDPHDSPFWWELSSTPPIATFANTRSATGDGAL